MTATARIRMSRAAWARRAEQQTLASGQELLRAAIANTDSVQNDTAFLLSLAQELCETRGKELTLAYRNLVQLMPGFRQQRCGRGRQTLETVCVICIVRRKVTVERRQRECLPRWLVLYAEHNHMRLPFAIPTDVQDAADYYSGNAHGFGHIWIKNVRLPAAMGHFACLVNLLHDEGQIRCLLSAQHVLTPYSDGQSFSVQPDLAVCADRNGDIEPGRAFANSLPYGGLLRNDGDPARLSLDVQLAEVTDEVHVAQRTPLRKLNLAMPYVSSPAELFTLGKKFSLLLPSINSNAYFRSISCTLAAVPAGPVPLEYRFAGPQWAEEHTVYHAGLLGFTCDSNHGPRAGDSGSSILFEHGDGSQTLIAMHIGGSAGKSWAIPAWQIFDLENWLQYPAGARIELIEPYA